MGRIIGGVASLGCLLLGLVGCGQPASPPAAGQAALATTSATLYYEGACSWLKCANCNDASGACQLGCDDGPPRIVIPSRSAGASCGDILVVCRGATCVKASVWDVSCCGRWEANGALMKQLGFTVGDGTCDATKACGSSGRFTHGFGQGDVTISSCGNGTCDSDESCASCPADCGPCCTPAQPCADRCGQQVDNCGGSYSCGPCCTPATCATAGASCGATSDGCGGTLDCGACAAGFSCVSNTCTCTASHYCGDLCGPQVDDCGATFDCGPCAGGGGDGGGGGTCCPEGREECPFECFMLARSLATRAPMPR